MPIIISRRSILLGFINGAHSRLITTREKPCSNQLPVTIKNREVGTSFARAFPRVRNWSHTGVVEALTLRPDTGIQNSNNDITFPGRLWQQVVVLLEPEKLGCACNVELISQFRQHRKNSGKVFK
ncbi:hypothetical protein HanPI659440_Chr15g0586001 [Helianthus annuus]|nr:hypothetical protein HanPI659440_Chr15g0586001 [Helianthus annuus]